jgi:hypothetical protein
VFHYGFVIKFWKKNWVATAPPPVCKFFSAFFFSFLKVRTEKRGGGWTNLNIISAGEEAWDSKTSYFAPFPHPKNYVFPPLPKTPIYTGTP